MRISFLTLSTTMMDAVKLHYNVRHRVFIIFDLGDKKYRGFSLRISKYGLFELEESGAVDEFFCPCVACQLRRKIGPSFHVSTLLDW